MWGRGPALYKQIIKYCLCRCLIHKEAKKHVLKAYSVDYLSCEGISAGPLHGVHVQAKTLYFKSK
jgi:hypothetical protein